jgi:hypothetical protein
LGLKLYMSPGFYIELTYPYQNHFNEFSNC